MMRNALAAFALVIVASYSAAAEPECRGPASTFNVAFPTTFQVSSAERIVGFELAVTSADVVGMTQIPKGWSMKLDSDKATQKISGSTQRKKDAIRTTAELPTFAISASGGEATSPALELEGIVYTSADLDTYVRHRFSCSDLIRPIAERGH